MSGEFRGSDYSHQSRLAASDSTFTPGSSYFENRIRLDFGPQAPFCGRQQELDALVDAYTRVVQTQRAASVWVQGGAGCGKSRLVEAFREEVDKLERKQQLQQTPPQPNRIRDKPALPETSQDPSHNPQQKSPAFPPIPPIPQPTTFKEPLAHHPRKQNTSFMSSDHLPLFCSAKFDQGQAASSEALGPILDCFNILTKALLDEENEQARFYWRSLLSLHLKNDLVVLAPLIPGLQDLEPPPMPAPMALKRSRTTTSGQPPPPPPNGFAAGAPLPPPVGIARSRTVGGPASTTLVPSSLAQSQPAAPSDKLPAKEQRTLATSQPTTSLPKYRNTSNLPWFRVKPVSKGLQRSKTLEEGPDLIQTRPPSSPRRIKSADDDPLTPLPELPPTSLDEKTLEQDSLSKYPLPSSSLDIPVLGDTSPPTQPSMLSLLGDSDQSLLGPTSPTSSRMMMAAMQPNPQDDSPPPPPMPTANPIGRAQTQQVTSPSPPTTSFPAKPSRATRAHTTGESGSLSHSIELGTSAEKFISTSNQRLQLKQRHDMSMRATMLRTPSTKNMLLQSTQRGSSGRKGGRKFKHARSMDVDGDNGTTGALESPHKHTLELSQAQRNQQPEGSSDNFRTSSAFSSSEQEDYSVERVQFALREYLRCVCKQRVVIFYFDDVQWSSREAVHLFRTLLMDHTSSSGPRRFLFLATHRPLSRGHDIIKLVNELNLAADRPSGITPTPSKPLQIAVDSFSQEDVVRLVARLLKREEEDVEPLAALVHRKTAGNCFFAIEFVRLLESKALIVYSLINYRWEWLDLNEIAAKTEISDNVVDVVASKICQAPQDIKLALLTAAAFGVARFSAHTLFRAIPGADDMRETLVRRASTEIQIQQALQSIQSVEALICTLEEACDESYLEALGASQYRFSHDRVREATVSLLPQGIDMNMLRLRIGRQLRRWLLESQQGGVVDEKLLLQVVIQLNQAADLITDEAERVELSELNFLAADNAIQHSSFFPASDFLRTGIDLLGDQPWLHHYEIMMKLSDALMRMDYCCGRLVVSVELANEILQHAKNFDDKKMAYHIKVLWLAQNDRVDQSLELILSVLDELGAPVPRRFLRIHKTLEWWRTQRMLRGLTDRRLLSLPDATAEHLDDIGSFMERLEEVALNGSNPRPNLLSVALLRVMQLTLKNGRFSMTPTCLVSWGWANARAGKLDAAHRFGELGVQLAKEESGGYHDERAILMYYMHIYHWRVPYHDGIKPTTEALQKLWDLGAIEYVFLDTITYLRIYFCCGLQLEPLAQDIRKYVDLLKDYGHRLAFENHVAFFQTVASLIGPSEHNSDHHLSGEFLTQSGAGGSDDDSADERSNDLALQQTMFQRMMLAYFFDNIDVALEMSNRMWPPFQEGHDVFLPFRVFFMGMTALSSYNRTRRIAQYRQGRKMMTLMQRWDESGVVNVHHMLFLMKAEHNAGYSRKDFVQVRRSFDYAIAKAARRGFLHFQALGNERAGIYSISKGEHEWARLYLVEAKNLYTEWGAFAKVQKMFRHYSDYLDGSSSINKRGSTINSRTRLSELSREAYKDLRTDESAEQQHAVPGSASTTLFRSTSVWYGAGGSAPLTQESGEGGGAVETQQSVLE